MEKVKLFGKILTPLLPLLLFCLISFACGPYSELDNSNYSTIEEKTFSTTPGKNFVLEAFSGDVAIAASEDSQVYIKVMGNEKTQKKVSIDFENSDDGVTVTAKKRDGWSFFNFGSGVKLKFEVMLPKNYNAKISTSGGDIILSGLTGKINLHSSGGDIKLKDTNGETYVSTSGGDLNATNSIGDLEFKTSGGDVNIQKFNGSVDASTSGGDIYLEGGNGKVRAHTSGGEIELKYTGSNYGIDLASSGGDVKVHLPSDFAADAKMYASGGNISCNLSSTSVVNISSSKYEAQINNGGAPLLLKSSGGDIIVSSK